MTKAFVTILPVLFLAGVLTGQQDGPSIVVRAPGAAPRPAGGDDLIMPTTQKLPPPQAPGSATGPLLADRVATVARDSSGLWWTIPEPRAGRGALFLLPCRNLETIEELNAAELRPGEAGPVTFKLSGEIFFYEGRSYLLVRKMLREEAQTAPVTAAAPATTSAPATASAPTTATAPTRDPDPLEADAGPSAEEIARMLLSGKPPRPIVSIRRPPTPPAPELTVAPAAEPLSLGPGEVINDKLARVVRRRGAEWATLVFETDNTLQEPPLRIMPNQWLQAMEDVTDQLKQQGAVFHVSGEVHRYHGKDYVLIRWAFLKTKMDEF